MAVRLRLRRIGKKKMPMYHIVAIDSRAKRDGKFLEVVGRYEPRQNPMVIQTKDERVMYWLGTGALPTDTVRSLLRRTGLWMRWSMKKRGDDDARIAALTERWTMAQVDRVQREKDRKARRAAARKKKRESAPAEPPTAPPAQS